MDARINEIAKRIIGISDPYDLRDTFGDEEEAMDGITYVVINDPLTVIEDLIFMIEDLQAEV